MPLHHLVATDCSLTPRLFLGATERSMARPFGVAVAEMVSCFGCHSTEWRRSRGGEKPTSRLVGVEYIVATVHHEGRVRFRRPQEEIDRVTHWTHGLRLKRSLAVDRSEACGLQEGIPVPSRHLERLCKPQHHVAARP